MPTYSAKVASPPRLSLILDFGASLNHASRHELDKNEFCQSLNINLATSSHPTVHMSAARWTGKGNLILTAGIGISQHQLDNAAPFIKQNSIIDLGILLHTDIPDFTTRPNVKWSKISMNGVPTGQTTDDQNPRTSEECHDALLAENPVYAALTVTQKPSWIRPLSEYKRGSISSLVLAFEDRDGTKLKELLSTRQLYLFGIKAKIRKWKQPPTHPQPPNRRHWSMPAARPQLSTRLMILHTQAPTSPTVSISRTRPTSTTSPSSHIGPATRSKVRRRGGGNLVTGALIVGTRVHDRACETNRYGRREQESGRATSYFLIHPYQSGNWCE